MDRSIHSSTAASYALQTFVPTVRSCPSLRLRLDLGQHGASSVKVSMQTNRPNIQGVHHSKIMGDADRGV